MTWRLFWSLQVSFPMARGGWPMATVRPVSFLLLFAILHFYPLINFQMHFAPFLDAPKIFINSTIAYMFQTLHFPQKFPKTSSFWPPSSSLRNFYFDSDAPNRVFLTPNLCESLGFANPYFFGQFYPPSFALVWSLKFSFEFENYTLARNFINSILTPQLLKIHLIQNTGY